MSVCGQRSVFRKLGYGIVRRRLLQFKIVKAFCTFVCAGCIGLHILLNTTSVWDSRRLDIPGNVYLLIQEFVSGFYDVKAQHDLKMIFLSIRNAVFLSCSLKKTSVCIRPAGLLQQIRIIDGITDYTGTCLSLCMLHEFVVCYEVFFVFPLGATLPSEQGTVAIETVKES